MCFNSAFNTLPYDLYFSLIHFYHTSSVYCHLVSLHYHFWYSPVQNIILSYYYVTRKNAFSHRDPYHIKVTQAGETGVFGKLCNGPLRLRPMRMFTKVTSVVFFSNVQFQPAAVKTCHLS